MFIIFKAIQLYDWINLNFCSRESKNLNLQIVGNTSVNIVFFNYVFNYLKQQ